MIRQVIVRVDASAVIGSGHVMRCLNLADGLRRHGAEVAFVCRDHAGELSQLIAGRGFRCRLLPPPAAGEWRVEGPAHATWVGAPWAVDAEETLQAVDELFGGPVDWLVLDHYGLEGRWTRRLRTSARHILVIDDLADRRHDADLLVDQNLVFDLERRYDSLTSAACTRLLGPRFALLAPEFAEWRARTAARQGPIRRILIYFGGADVADLTGLALDACLHPGRQDLTVDVVAREDSPHFSRLHRLASQSAAVRLHGCLDTLAPLIAAADLAIGAAGVSSWERLCLGLPALVVTLADNQRPIAAELARRGLIRWLGHVGEVDEAAMREALGGLLRDGLPTEWSRPGAEVVDGQGVGRVCTHMLQS